MSHVKFCGERVRKISDNSEFQEAGEGFLGPHSSPVLRVLFLEDLDQWKFDA